MPHHNQSNAATAIALFGLLLISAAILGLMALVLPELLGVLIVLLIFAVPAVFHYLVWGRWLSQMRGAPPVDETIENKTATVDPP